MVMGNAANVIAADSLPRRIQMIVNVRIRVNDMINASLNNF
jgi:hypothetical protein